ncbi:cytochrome P450 [Trematosphaeria pertusa]|uniref:Cytochrome P450 n=1 Tax=Trematosphaeria pertusa TaxID=390896 RepID=A0A6A6J0Y1_9PLEO|nr:cytochrome P450 [Trematosphaeria pertusa]KAF2256296.1 cytochrome P450 [Trematosphaeria pertusa]
MPKYNAAFGHLLVLKEHMDDLPVDCTTNTSFLKIAKQFPNGLFYFDLWPFANPLLIVNTPSAANQLAQAPLDKPEQIYHAFRHLTDGPNLFTMKEERWKVWRVLFNPGFSASYMLELVPAIVKEAAVFCDLLHNHAQRAAMFQLENLTIKLTIDIIGAVSVNSRWNYQLRDHPLASALRTQIEWTTFGTEMNPFNRYHILRPLILWYNNRRLGNLINSEIMKRYKELRNSSTGKGDSAVKPSKSIITLTLKEYLKEKDISVAETPSKEFLEVASAQLRLFLFAGHDTTSSVLIYCYHALSMKPEAMKRLRAEHDEVFGDVSTTAETIVKSPQLLNQLPYTLAVIKESLRLWPPASCMRAGKAGVNIVDDNGTSFPTEGCYVWQISLLLHRNPTYWKDPDSFIPERWLVGPEDPLYPIKGTWRPFEFGSRSCLGQTLALTELKVVLVMTARNFDIQPAYDQWDQEHKSNRTRSAEGNRAYQVEGGGGGAHPAERYPCTVTFRG